MIAGKPSLWFRAGLTLVFSQRNYTIIGADSEGTWFRFPISAGFSYNPNMNLVVELGRGPNTIPEVLDTGISIMVHGTTWRYNNIYTMGLGWTNGGDKIVSLRVGLMDIGFDDAPTTVGGLVNLKGFYAYPNPSEGLFTVGFEPWSGHAATVQVSVTDMAGRQVWQRSYQGVQASLFTANVDLRGLPKGIYLLRVQADVAQALQRVMLE
ncbi:MAG: T9SS type A sorting domain-containing protein [Bacteroidetes bacterium]|nr:T9SS type A sorting domain-containing protein [Bacteroidota bacterium]